MTDIQTPVEALRELEKLESELSQVGGAERLRRRITEIRSEFGDLLLEQAIDEAVSDSECIEGHDWCRGPGGWEKDSRAFGGLCGSCYIKSAKGDWQGDSCSEPGPEPIFVKSKSTGQIYTVKDGMWTQVAVEEYDSEGDFPELNGVTGND